MADDRILVELDDEQREAATTKTNVVVAAGAGSGKTKVLAARYAWLVMERKYRVGEILTLTFTNKAVNTMYSRIYGLLAAHQDNPEAGRGIRDFHKAQISTLDSFCARIARTAARRYGIRSDFVINDGGVRKLARDAALPFVLNHRDNRSLQLLMADRKIRILAEELFAEVVVKYSPLSNPLDFNSFKQAQGGELLRQWDKKTREAAELTATIRRELEEIPKKSNSFYLRINNALAEPLPPVPDIRRLLEKSGFLPDTGETAEQDEEKARREITRYFEYLFNLKVQSHQGGNGAEFAPLKETLNELRNPLYGELESLANMALQCGLIAEVFPLIDEFQEQFNRQKREAGLLSFQDLAHLAVDALARFPDIRKVYKDMFRAIMIDEFQDNNRLQRDLIFLLAENPNRMEPGIPRAEELCPDKLFFVGDEKQSIYRFRGADVSVFRSLARILSGVSGDKSSLHLIHNYRSKPSLIGAFNFIFGGLAPEPSGKADSPTGVGVFLSADGEGLPDRELADFEASYSRIYPSPSRAFDPEDREDPPVYFCFLDKDRIPEDDPGGTPGARPGELSAPDLEAAFIAARIREMVDSGYAIEQRESGSQGAVTKRPCAYGDFAVLQRSYTHQIALEKQFKVFNIPFTADKPTGLFTDAPINDLYNLLRLLAYPADRMAYAALIRSPFMRLSDLTLSVCMLHEGGLPFDEALDSLVPPEELALYREARRHYHAWTLAARELSLTALLTKLWYEEGYRYETTWSASSQIYGELFDLFFELARLTEIQGETLVDFVDYLSGLIGGEEKLDELDVPAERTIGVRIMSIHKSKGLEFPVVFVYYCGGRGANTTNVQPVYFNEEFGITLNLPQAEELPENNGNYFFNRQKEEEGAKKIAELRRLLYVAMTRAENALFITATLPERTAKEKEDFKAEDEDYTPERLRERLRQLCATRENKPIASFLDLLLPILAAQTGAEAAASAAGPPFSIRAIPVVSREELGKRSGSSGGTGRPAGASAAASPAEAAQAAAAFYAGASLTAEPDLRSRFIPASSLRGPDADQAGSDEDELSRLLKRTGLDPADFGALVHELVEARFTGRKPSLRLLAALDEKNALRIQTAAREMEERFFASGLGQRSLQAAYRETEFPIITFLTVGGKTVTITGQIDLLFEWEGVIQVVDFKTDRFEDPDHHRGQLTVYARAAGDIFGKPVRSWLFFLRTGHEAELTGRIKDGDIEKILAAQPAL
ncbi:MAG: UvrD-helicase domain-containing protein [Spirochaetaceae bacterium]|jgi:ATP-dependent helicase/nuclease subunit A|nr:UvrD-helicase domain-containing protein [Spirochaetaceae bacterium]